MSEYTNGGTRAGAAAIPFATGNFAPMIEAAARTSNACGRAYLAWQDELLRFTSTRLQRDAEFGSNLLKCDKWADAARLQQDWMATTVEDYVSEANKLFELATNLTSDVARTSTDTAQAAAAEARRAPQAVGEYAGGMADTMGRFARQAGEGAGAVADEMRKSAESAGTAGSAMAEAGRKAAEEAGASARERNPKRR